MGFDMIDAEFYTLCDGEAFIIDILQFFKICAFSKCTRPNNCKRDNRFMLASKMLHSLRYCPLFKWTWLLFRQFRAKWRNQQRMPQVYRAWAKPSDDLPISQWERDLHSEGNIKLIATQWHAHFYQLGVHSAGQCSTSQSIKQRPVVRTREKSCGK